MKVESKSGLILALFLLIFSVTSFILAVKALLHYDFTGGIILFTVFLVNTVFLVKINSKVIKWTHG